MTEFLKGWVLNITGLVLFIVLLEMLLPSGRMKKYASLVTGVLLIIAIIKPFLDVYGKGIDLEGLQIKNSNFIERMDIGKSSNILETEQNRQILDVYRDKMIRQLEKSALAVKGVSKAKADIILNEDFESDGFGQLERVYFELAAGNMETRIGLVTDVKKIEVKKIEPIDNNTKKEKSEDYSNKSETNKESEDNLTEEESIENLSENGTNNQISKMKTGIDIKEIENELRRKIVSIYGVAVKNIVITWIGQE